MPSLAAHDFVEAGAQWAVRQAPASWNPDAESLGGRYFAR